MFPTNDIDFPILVSVRGEGMRGMRVACCNVAEEMQ